MATWQDRLRDARGFWEVAEAFNDPDHRNQAASNAILALIAANDAVCLRLIQQRPRGESHAEATQLLQQACRDTVWEREAAAKSRQFLEVIRHKAAVQYEGRLLSSADLQKIMKQVQRFLDWAEEVFAAE